MNSHPWYATDYVIFGHFKKKKIFFRSAKHYGNCLLLFSKDHVMGITHIDCFLEKTIMHNHAGNFSIHFGSFEPHEIECSRGLTQCELGLLENLLHISFKWNHFPLCTHLYSYLTTPEAQPIQSRCHALISIVVTATSGRNTCQKVGRADTVFPDFYWKFLVFPWLL